MDDWSIRGSEKRKRTSAQAYFEKDPRKRSRFEEEWKIKGGGDGSRSLNTSRRGSEEESYSPSIFSPRGSASSPHAVPDTRHPSRRFDAPPPPPIDTEYPLSPRSRSPDSLFVSDAPVEYKRGML